MLFQIVIISPPGYQHAAAFTEVAEALAYGLRALGHDAKIGTNRFGPGAVNIVLGIHLLPPPALAELPQETVVYNLEQVEDHLFEWAPQLKEVFRRFEVWDYSKKNIQKLSEMGLAGPRLRLLPVGTVPELCRIPKAPRQDIDVLFYGVVNERRRLALKAIQDRGLNLAAVFGCYGAARDELIARAKLVVNLHKHEAQVFEVVRVSYLLANRKAVVAEMAPTTAIDADLRDAVAGVTYEDMAGECARLVADPAARGALEERGFAAMTARSQADYLRILLEQRASNLTHGATSAH